MKDFLSYLAIAFILIGAVIANFGTPSLQLLGLLVLAIAVFYPLTKLLVEIMISGLADNRPRDSQEIVWLVTSAGSFVTERRRVPEEREKRSPERSEWLEIRTERRGALQFFAPPFSAEVRIPERQVLESAGKGR